VKSKLEYFSSFYINSFAYECDTHIALTGVRDGNVTMY